MFKIIIGWMEEGVCWLVKIEFRSKEVANECFRIGFVQFRIDYGIDLKELAGGSWQLHKITIPNDDIENSNYVADDVVVMAYAQMTAKAVATTKWYQEKNVNESQRNEFKNYETIILFWEHFHDDARKQHDTVRFW